MELVRFQSFTTPHNKLATILDLYCKALAYFTGHARDCLDNALKLGGIDQIF